jgi:stearoyl-CoA desaturase (Delta-9 desaturase)
MPGHPQYPTIDDQGRITTANRINALIFVIIIPTAATILALGLLIEKRVTWTDFWIFAGMYIAPAIGVTVGYHRLFTHRSFETFRPVRYLLAVLGCAGAEGGPIIWASQHRRHHAFADKTGDPHSPHVGRQPGFVGALRALWHSHYGHVFQQAVRIEPERYAPDLEREPFLRALEKFAVLPVAAGFVLPFGIGYLATGRWAGAWSGLLWGGFVRLFVQTHVVGAVNSIGHFFGSQRFDLGDDSRNVWWLAPMSLGEGWHNSHHAFPTSARHGLEWWEIDFSWMIIWSMEKVGLAWNVVRISPERQAQKIRKRIPELVPRIPQR